MERFRSEDFGDVFNVLENDDGGNILDFDALEFALDAQNDFVVPPDPPGVMSFAAPKLEPQMMAFNKPSDGSSDSVGHSGESHHHPAFVNFDWKSLGVKKQPSDDFTAEAETASQPQQKKKRTRNQEQMQMNRIAQQKYRERKKAEQSELKTAVDQLAAQLAAFKALEVRTTELQHHNDGLQETVKQQAQQMSSQQAIIASQQTQLNEAAVISMGQQKMILEQHKKLQLQEQIILQLKDRLKSSVESALSNLSDGNVCEQVLGAVKTALYGAKDVEGLSELLEKLPDVLVVEICKNIMATCKKLWPELHQQVHSRCSTWTAGTVAPVPMG